MPTRPLVTHYAQDLSLFPDRWHRIGLVAAILLVLLFPLAAGDQGLSVALDAMIAVVGAAGMMILTGFCGQVSLGHAAFLAIGAYSAAILGSELGLPFWLVLPAAGALAAVVGLAIGPFALRLEGLYLAIVTLGLLFLVEHVLRNLLDVVYGKDYLPVPMFGLFADRAARHGLGSFREAWRIAGWVIEPNVKLYLLFAGLAAAALWIGKNLRRSSTGRAMIAVRDRDLAAAALGVDPARTKLIAFGVSSFFAGVAGAMYGFAHPVVTLEPFGLAMSVRYLAMVILGGMGTIFGAAAGAIAFVSLGPIAEAVGARLPFPSGFSSENQSVLLVYPLLALFLALEPLGLFGLWLRIQRYFLPWPFKY